MKTLTVDDRQRVRIPGAKPRSKFAYEKRGEVVTLTPVAPIEALTVPVRIEKRRGFSVGVSDQPVSLEAIKTVLADFP